MKRNLNLQIVNTFVISIAFFFIFTAFNTGQNFATTVDPKLGSISLGILYACWIISLFFLSPWAISRCGLKFSLFISSFAFGLYFLASIEIITAIYIIASMLLGIAAGPLWAAQGAFVQISCNMYEMEKNIEIDSKIGYFNAIFFFFLQQSKFIGNLLAALIFQFGGNIVIFYTCLTILCFIGSFIFIFLKLSKNDEIKATKKLSQININTSNTTNNNDTMTNNQETAKLKVKSDSISIATPPSEDNKKKLGLDDKDMSAFFFRSAIYIG